MITSHSITCPKCQRTITDRKEIMHGFCSQCRDYTSVYPDLYVIYDHPSDYPHDFVCVHCRGPRRMKACGTSNTLEGARTFVPAGAINIGRFIEDDPKIKEVWI